MAILNPRNLSEVAVKFRFRYVRRMESPEAPMPRMESRESDFLHSSLESLDPILRAKYTVGTDGNSGSSH